MNACNVHAITVPSAERTGVNKTDTNIHPHGTAILLDDPPHTHTHRKNINKNKLERRVDMPVGTIGTQNPCNEKTESNKIKFNGEKIWHFTLESEKLNGQI